jgi:hypothetical protein
MITERQGMAKQQPGIERRKFVRVAEEDLLICEPFDAAVFGGDIKKRVHVFTKSLSEGGVLFEAGQIFEIGALLKLQLDIPGWEKYKVEFYKGNAPSGRDLLVALARVVRVEDLGGGNFDIGVAFVALDSGHKVALRKYLELDAADKKK